MVYQCNSFLLHPDYGDFIAWNQYAMSLDECQWDSTLFIPLGQRINSSLENSLVCTFWLRFRYRPEFVEGLYWMIVSRLTGNEHACNRKMKALCNCRKIIAFYWIAVQQDAKLNRTFSNCRFRLKKTIYKNNLLYS